MFRVPVLLIGEFDQSVGFNITDAFELFAERRMSTCRCAVRACSVVDDRIVLGKCVLCGSLRRTLQSRMNTLAARTLGADLTSGYSSILTDPALGGIACVTFELRDHEARATRRKCCLLLVVPDEESLVSRWHLICPGLELLAARWEALSQEIIEQETLERDTSSYRTNVQPDRLRRVDELLAPKILPTESAALVEVMLMFTCSRKVQLLASNLINAQTKPGASDNAVFRSPIKHLACEPPPMGFRQHIKAQLDKAIDRRSLCVVTAPVTEGRPNCFHFEACPTSQILEQREVVVPFGALLSKIFRAELNNINSFSIKVAPLLIALFSGNQIVVDVHPDCGVSPKSILTSLAEILPRSLRKVQPLATDYVPPNQCRILAFSPRKEFVVTRETEHFGKDVFVLSELKDPATVIFQLTPSSAKVTEVSQILREAGVEDGDLQCCEAPGPKRDSGLPSNKFIGSEEVINQGNFTKSPLSFPTLINRVLMMVKVHCETTRNADADRFEIEESLLQCQLVQLVREYVCRGRLYTKMLRRQKEQQYLAAMAGRQQKQSFSSRVMSLIFRKPSNVVAASAAPTNARPRRPSVVMVDPLDSQMSGARYEKQSSGLSAVSRSARFISAEEAADPHHRAHKNLSKGDLCDVLPVDHDTLVFLGTVCSPFGPRDTE
jgi:hypothetical protein